MREAVIVSTARTPIGKAYRGAFNNLESPLLGAHALRGALQRAGLEGSEVEEVILGSALTQGSAGVNLARHTVLAAGLPETVAAATIDRQCASGLDAIATAAHRIVAEGVEVAVAGGLDSISLVQNDQWNDFRYRTPGVPGDYYLSMIATAERVAARYGVTRSAQDEYALQSQAQTAEAQRAGLLAEEIVPVETVQIVHDRETGQRSEKHRHVETDECNRPSTTAEALAALPPVQGPGHTVTAGNASQLSDGAAACVLLSAEEAGRRGLQPLGAFRGFTVIGVPAAEMGIGPLHAIPRLLKRTGLTREQIGLWEINEAFAAQVLPCRDELGLPPDRVNVLGGAIALGHPHGTSGARMAGTRLREGRRRGVRYGVASLCVGGGQGAAGLFEIY